MDFYKSSEDAAQCTLFPDYVNVKEYPDMIKD
jgi:hypothetical protein